MNHRGSGESFKLKYKHEWWNPDPVSIVLKDESRFLYPSYFCCCWFSIFYFVWMTNHLTHIRIWHRSNVTSSLPNIVGKIKLNCKTFAIAKCCHIHKSPFHLIKQNTIFKKWSDLQNNGIENNKLNRNIAMYLNFPILPFSW